MTPEAQAAAAETELVATNEEVAERAKMLREKAQSRRDANDRTGAAIYYAEAITLLRTTTDTAALAHALRHAAEIRSEMHEYGVAGTQIEEAIRLYRAFDPPAPLELANALRVEALNDEREAMRAWREARNLYTAVGVTAGVEECEQHLDCFKQHPDAFGQERKA